MRFIKFAEAKKAPRKLLRPARSANVATKQVLKSIVMGAGRKGLLWQEQGMSAEDMKKKMEAFGVKLKNKKRELAKKINDNYKKNYLKSTPVKSAPSKSLNQALLDNGIDVSKLERAPMQSNSKSVETVIKPKGGGKGLLIGAGVAAGTVALGGLGYGLYRKMRSDKGKKRGSYKNFTFLGQLTNL
jgi:hypothetical protein